MGLQLIRIFFPVIQKETDLMECETRLILKLKDEFILKLNLDEEPYEEFILHAKERFKNDKPENPFTWINLSQDEKDGYFELDAHIKDGRIEEYPKYSKIFYKYDINLNLESLIYDDEICPITIQLACNVSDKKHMEFFDSLEDFIRYAYKIQFYIQEGYKETSCIHKLSKEYLLKSQKSFPEDVGKLENEMDELIDLFDTISYSVSRLLSIKNQVTLNLENISKIRAKIINDYNMYIDIRYIQKKKKELDYRIKDSQFFLELLKDKKDITLGKVGMEENKQLLRLHQDASVLEEVAFIISIIIIFQGTLQIMSLLVPNYSEATVFLKIGIPLLISIFLLSTFELIKEIFLIIDRKKTFSLKIFWNKKILFFFLLTIISLLSIIVYFRTWIFQNYG